MVSMLLRPYLRRSIFVPTLSISFTCDERYSFSLFHSQSRPQRDWTEELTVSFFIQSGPHFRPRGVYNRHHDS
jgi:hypothetical protein